VVMLRGWQMTSPTPAASTRRHYRLHSGEK